LLLANVAHASLTVTARGSGNNNTAGTSLVCTPTSNMGVSGNNMGVLVISADNVAASGACCGISSTTVTDSAGNTWTKQLNKVYDPGAASAGVEMAIFTAPMPNGLSTSQNVTITFAASATAKTYAFWEVAAGTGNAANFVSAAASCDNCTTGQTGTTQTFTTVSLTLGDAVIAVMTCEGNPTFTADSDTTNGSWSSAQTNTAGSAGTGNGIITQAKVVNNAGTQTYDTSTSSSVDWTMGYARLNEVAGPTPTPSPTPSPTPTPGVVSGGNFFIFFPR